MPSRRPSARSHRGLVLVALGIGTLLAAVPRAAWAQPGLAFGPPHAVRAPAARLDAATQTRVATALARAHPATVPDAITFALAQSGQALHVGLGHRTTLVFTGREREGNCIEYAHYFGRVFDLAAQTADLRARAWVVRSDATVFGRHIPLRGFRDHDWVLVEDAAGHRWYVDPTLGDAALGWNIAARVHGDVRGR